MPLWKSDTFWGIVGFAVGIVGLLMAIIFYYLGKTRKILEYSILSTRLITEEMAKIPGLTVSIYDQPVRNLISTTLRINNAGNQTVLGADFAALAPLTAKVTGYFLDTQYGYHISTSNPNSGLSIKQIKGDTVHIEFDFLKPKQFIEITLLHDGNISLTGELKSGKFREYRTRFELSTIIIFVQFLMVVLNGVCSHNALLSTNFISVLTVVILVYMLTNSIIIWHKNK